MNFIKKMCVVQFLPHRTPCRVSHITRTQQSNRSINCGVVQHVHDDSTVRSKSPVERNYLDAVSLWRVIEPDPSDTFSSNSKRLEHLFTNTPSLLMLAFGCFIPHIITADFKILDATAYWDMNQARNWPFKTLSAWRKWLSAWKSLHRQSLHPWNVA